MDSLSIWLAVAAMGVLHGLNPFAGWAVAAAFGAQGWKPTMSALAPIAAGHAVSVALAGAAVAYGLSMNRASLMTVAGALLAAAATAHLLCRTGRKRIGRKRHSAAAQHAGLALWTFIMSTVHGAGLMIAPAMMTLCIGGAPVGEPNTSGSMLMLLVTVGVHTIAMLLVTGIIATGVCHAMHTGRRWLLAVVRPDQQS